MPASNGYKELPNVTALAGKTAVANEPAAMARSNRKPLIVADPRSFFRGCLSCWLEEFGGEFVPIVVAKVADAAENDLTSVASAAVLCAPLPLAGRAWLEEQVAHLRASAPDLPIIVILDEVDPAVGQEIIAGLGLQGCIPMSSSLEVAAAALRLVIAGGCYYPWQPGMNPERPVQPSPAKDMPAARPAGAPRLTPREQAVLDLLTKGLPNKIIAYQLGLALSTVKIHVHHIIEKLNVQNRTEVAIWGCDARSPGSYPLRTGDLAAPPAAGHEAR